MVEVVTFNKISKITKFCIKTHKDKYDCWVPCILDLTATQLIVTDWGNSCLKIIDTTTNTNTNDNKYNAITKRRPLRSKPWGITSINELCIAVTFPNDQLIRFFKTDLDDYENSNPIKVNGRCLGIQCSKDVLVISYIVPEPKIEIIDLNKRVLIKIPKIVSENPLFIWPMYFTIAQDEDVIYVSDNSKQTLTCMSRKGDVQWIYEVKYPASVAIETSGFIYVSSNYTDNSIHETIHVVSSVGKKVDIIPQSKSEAKDCLTRRYSNYHNAALYVSSGVSSVVKSGVQSGLPKRKEPSPLNSIEALRKVFEKDPTFHNQNTPASKNDETPNSSGDGSDGLTICSLNVGGLEGRIEALKSDKYFGKYDILCLNETHRTNTDTYGSPGYKSFMQLRKQKGEYKSGGIEIYVRESLESHVKEINCDCEYVLWIRLVHSAIQEPLALGAVYIPKKETEGTGFWKEDIYSDFEHELISKCAAFKNVIITGDFNCRTSTECDYKVDDESYDRFSNISGMFKRLSIPLNRSSMDTRKSCAIGKRLLDICKENSLFILNGRVSADKGIGKYTNVTKTKTGRVTAETVIDYTIATGECFEFLKSFDVIETHRGLSNGHNAMVFKLGS